MEQKRIPMQNDNIVIDPKMKIDRDKIFGKSKLLALVVSQNN